MNFERTGHAPPLAELQDRFAAALLDPVLGGDLAQVCQGPAAVIERRFDLYRGNLRATWEKALAAAYPIVQRYVGEEFFFAMSGQYGAQFPSRGGDLNRFGIDLPSFLEQFPPAAAHPWLPDLARLEWAVHCSHYAADAEPLQSAAVAALSADALDGWAVRLHPACALVASQWNIAALWLWHQGAEPATWTEEIRRPCTALVWRPRWKVEVRALGEGESVGLARLAAGARLGDALEGAFAADAEADIAALFAGWLRDGLLIGPDPQPGLAPGERPARG